jgi:hypothetical protein
MIRILPSRVALRHIGSFLGLGNRQWTVCDASRVLTAPLVSILGHVECTVAIGLVLQ